MSALVSVSVPCNIPIETSSSRCHLEIKARGVVSVILVCGLKHQNMAQASLCSFSGGEIFFAAIFIPDLPNSRLVLLYSDGSKGILRVPLRIAYGTYTWGAV